MSSKTSKPQRVASAIILVSGTGRSLRVFLVKRAEQLRFFGGYHAFIGGVREPLDGPDDTDGSDHTALRNCAVRELFEETGVLVDPILAAAPPEQLRSARASLLERDATDHEPWVALRAKTDEVRGVREFCRITTPPFAPVRYATAFFIAELPPEQSPEILPGELVDGSWWRPTDALEAWHRGEVEIVPPALILLELLADGDIDAFCERAAATAAGYADGKLHEVRFSPGIVLAPLATETLPPATTTNCLIVGGAERWIVDPASPDTAEQQRLFGLCDSLVSDNGSRIAGILSTHHHPDHVGAIAACCDRFGVEVRGHAVTLDRLPPGCAIGSPLEDGDTIDLGMAPDGSSGWTLEAIFTPGHDRGHLCFRESRYGALIAGDMVSTLSTIIIDPPEGHLQTYMDSLARLASLELSTIYPAHGPAVRNGQKVLERFIAHRLERERKLIAALGSDGRSIEDLVQEVYADTDPRMHPYAARSLCAGLEKLESEQRAIRSGTLWRGA